MLQPLRLFILRRSASLRRAGFRKSAAETSECARAPRASLVSLRGRISRRVWLALHSTAFFVSAVWLIAGGCAPWASGRNGGGASVETAAKVTTKRDGNLIHFWVENRELSEVTVTFDFRIANLVASVDFPHTATFRPGKTLAFTLSALQPEASWRYSFTNYIKLGSSEAVHDDSVLYQLPYGPGGSFTVSQGYNGAFSHQGANQYAIDWKMPEGTPVCAARGGRVVRVKADSDTGGGSIEYDACNNFVLIRHEDGTLGHYCHLQHDGVKVHAGQEVRAGEVIALSGSTGFSSGPHLHFCVFKAHDGRKRVTIPVRFEDAFARGATLVEGRRYARPRAPFLAASSGIGRP